MTGMGAARRNWIVKHKPAFMFDGSTTLPKQFASARGRQLLADCVEKLLVEAERYH
jgi:hypothetical protein